MQVKIVYVLGCLAVLSALSGCSGGRENRAQKSLVRFIKRYEKNVVPLSTRKDLAQWDYYRTGNAAAQHAYDSLLKVESRYLHNEKAFSYLKKMKKEGSVRDPYLERQLDILYKIYIPYQADLQLQEKISDMEAVLRHKLHNRVNDTQYRKAEYIVRNESDRETLYRAWCRLKSDGEAMEDSVRKLVALRNLQAEQAGFDNFYQMRLFQEGLDETYLTALFAELKQKTDTAYASVKHAIDKALALKGAKVPRGAWLYRGHFLHNGILSCTAARDRYYNHINMEQMAVRFFAGIGLPLDDVMKESILYTDTAAGAPPVFACLNLDRKSDIRIIGHLQGAENDMRQLLARMGQAAYYKYIPNSLPYLLRYPATKFLERGVSTFFGRMAGYSDWILSMGMFSLSQAERLQHSYKEEMRQEELMGVRWALFMFEFEYTLYKRASDADFHPGYEWQRMLKEYMLFEPDTAQARLHDWATEPYFSIYRTSSHNWILGKLTASALLEYFCENHPQIGSVQNPDLVGVAQVGIHLQKRLFNTGSTKEWSGIIEDVLGGPLTCEPFLKQFVY